MDITVKRNNRLVEVVITEGRATVETGLLDEGERDRFAQEMLEALYAMGPATHEDCIEWIFEMSSRVGIDLASGGAQ